MASTSSTSQYTFQRPSTTATRTLVSKPGELPSASSHDAKPSSDAHPNTTQPSAGSNSDNYAQAVAAAKSSSDRPGFDRQQSWSLSDKKRQMAEQMLQGSQGHNAQGYASTAASAGTQ